jgi:hypothetical protein
MKQKIEGVAEGTTKMALSVGNIKGVVDSSIDSTFKASVAFGQFASAAMSASMVISSIRNAVKVWSDESATGFEKIGAAISILMPLYSAFNAVSGLSTTLLKIETV